jgi:hypothetical protein
VQHEGDARGAAGHQADLAEEDQRERDEQRAGEDGLRVVEEAVRVGRRR